MNANEKSDKVIVPKKAFEQRGHALCGECGGKDFAQEEH